MDRRTWIRYIYLHNIHRRFRVPHDLLRQYSYDGHRLEQSISVEELTHLGIDWPKYPLIQENALVENERVNLKSTIDKLRSSLAYYDGQITDDCTEKTRVTLILQFLSLEYVCDLAALRELFSADSLLLLISK